MLKENRLLKLATERRKRAMSRLRLRGWTDQQIADRYAISRARAQKILGPKK